MTAVDTGAANTTTAERALPYAGPRSLHQGEPIYGRNREIKELRGTILSERIVLLYSPSGAGKTSLIEAGLRPELARRRFQMLPTIRVGTPAPVEAGGVNRYRLSVLASLEEGRHLEAQFAPEELETMPLADYLLDRAGEEPDLDPCLIFDQFEEVFTLDPTDWSEKEAFLHELGDALHDRSYFAVFAMREDFIAQLDPYRDFMPTRFGNRYRLALLNPSAARDAIQKPAAAAGVDFTDEAAERLVDDLRRVRVQRGMTASLELGPSVEPVQLQVVCSRLWANLPRGTSAIQPSHIAAAGSVNQALADFYSREVETVALRNRVKEHLIRDWFEEALISDDGFRMQTREGPGKSGTAVVDGLENAHLIRADRRRGALWYELTHDRFVEPIRFSNAAFRARRRKKTARRAIIVAAVAAAALLLVVLALLLSEGAATESLAPPATDLNGQSPPPFEVAPNEVKRFRFDGLRGAVVTIGVTSEPPMSLTVRLIQVGTGNSETTEVEPIGSAASDEAPAVEDPSQGTTTTQAQRLEGVGSAPQQTPDRPTGTFDGQYDLPGNGTYLIEIIAAGQVESAQLTLEFETSHVPSLVADEPARGTIDDGESVDRFAFDGRGEEDVMLVLRPDPTFDGMLALLDEGGNELQAADSWAAGVDEVVVGTLLETGVYSVEVSGFSGSTGGYELTLLRPTIAGVDIGGQASGSIAEPGRRTAYAFEADEGAIVSITVSPAPGLDAALELIDPAGVRQVRDFFGSGAAEHLVVSPLSGRHVLLVSGIAETAGSFEVSIESPDIATIQPGELVSGSVSPGQPHLYSFDAVAGAFYSVLDDPTDLLIVEIVAPGSYPVLTSTFGVPFDGRYALSVDALEATDYDIAVVDAAPAEIAFGEQLRDSADEFGWTRPYGFFAGEGDSYSVTLTPLWEAVTPWLVVTAPDGFLEAFMAGEGKEPVTVSGTAPLDGFYVVTWVDQFPTGDFELSLEP